MLDIVYILIKSVSHPSIIFMSMIFPVVFVPSPYPALQGCSYLVSSLGLAVGWAGMINNAGLSVSTAVAL